MDWKVTGDAVAGLELPQVGCGGSAQVLRPLTARAEAAATGQVEHVGHDAGDGLEAPLFAIQVRNGVQYKAKLFVFYIMLLKLTIFLVRQQKPILRGAPPPCRGVCSTVDPSRRQCLFL